MALATPRLALLGLLLGLLLLAPAPASAAPPSSPLSQASPCAIAVATAVNQRGLPYVWGAKGPGSFDCSGLTHFAWSAAGYNIGLSTYDQVRAGQPISCNLSHLNGASTTCWQPGDLAVLRYTGGQHVAIYIGDGLFADAYNEYTGVIIHRIELDSFYQANWWQARRIVDCAGAGGASGLSPEAPIATVPSIEQLPALLGFVFFSVPQCGQCNPDGSIILPATSWSGSWPSGFELLSIGTVMQTVASWIIWQVSEVVRQLICWLLAMLGLLASFATTGANAIIGGINQLAQLLILLWLALRDGIWLVAEMRGVVVELGAALEGIGQLAAVGLQALVLLGELLGQLLALVGQLVISTVGSLGWIVGLVFGLWPALVGATASTSVPAQLATTHDIYRVVRGIGDGLMASQAAWLMYLLWAMAYIAFGMWMARFMSSSGREG